MPARSLPTEQESGQPSLEDLMVQAEIFLQYSLQPKALERLQRVAQLFPGSHPESPPAKIDALGCLAKSQ